MQKASEEAEEIPSSKDEEEQVSVATEEILSSKEEEKDNEAIQETASSKEDEQVSLAANPEKTAFVVGDKIELKLTTNENLKN